MTNNISSILQSYKYKHHEPYKITKPKLRTKKNESKLPDLRQSLNSHIKVLFVGFNPGIDSSIQQHHYANHTNLFWKLFNQSHLLQKVIQVQNISFTPQQQNDNNNDNDDDKDNYNYLNKLLTDGCSAKDDFELIKYNIGFTDLVLRCTRKAEELSLLEKLDNVPRLLNEFKFSKLENIIIVGKGIWEIIVKYISRNLQLPLKLTKKNFSWGLQDLNDMNDMTDKDNKNYKLILESIYKTLPKSTKLYVFPNTSGLVAGIPFSEKLNLWQIMVNGIQ